MGSPIPEKEVLTVFRLLDELYPNAKTELTYANPFQLTIAVILSAQCTDARVNQVTPHLFKKFPTPQKLAAADPLDVEEIIHSCGFYKAKTRSIIGCAKGLVENFKGVLPETLEELVTLPGVGRKSASVVLNQAFGLPAIAVDTHVVRVSNRLGWAHSENPEKIETELKELVPMKYWGAVNTLLILHGRRICKARKPLCEECVVNLYCAHYRNL